MSTNNSLSATDRDAFRRLLDLFPHANTFEKEYVEKAKIRGWLTLQHLPRATGGAQRILDVGSMKGIYAPAYMRIWGYSEAYLLGDDTPHEGSIEIPDGANDAFRFPCARCDIETQTWPLESNFFDTVVCTEVLEHMMFDPVFVMNEICRVLKPGGRCILTTPNTSSDSCLTYLVNGMQPGFLRYYSRTPLEAGQRDLKTVSLMGHFHEYTRADLECLIQATGFETIFLKGISPSRPLLNSVRFRLLRQLVRILFPRSKRIREDHLIALIRKNNYCPLDQLANRYPSPLYQKATA
ncbi:MAG: hypothetical protein A2X46_05075 [Lentisphaerae bacterium GWF2_57_35]|nr:MAG: hypothetical protein A2X46_05075 [Lentisphaerae bacterium GWF2_57_35]